MKAITTVQRSRQKLGQRGAIRRVPGMSGGIQSDLHRNGFSRIHGLVEPFTGRTMPFRDLCHFRTWLKQAMDKRGYRTYQEGIMVQASASPAERNKFRPDVVVRCGSLSDNSFISDPIVVIEVVSPSTVDLDLGRKLQFYRELPTVQHVVLAYEDRKQVEHHRRTETDWERTVLTKQGNVLVLDAVEFSMDLNGIYFDVSL